MTAIKKIKIRAEIKGMYSKNIDKTEQIDAPKRTEA